MSNSPETPVYYSPGFKPSSRHSIRAVADRINANSYKGARGIYETRPSPRGIPALDALFNYCICGYSTYNLAINSALEPPLKYGLGP